MTSTRLTERTADLPRPLTAPAGASRARAGDALFGTGLAGLLVLAAWAGRGVWFFIDEWTVITTYPDGHWLRPFNGHLSLVPIAIYRGLLGTVGYDFAYFRAAGLVCYAAAAIAVFWFARHRVDPLAAALAGLAVAWSSQARLVVMFPLLLNFTVPVAAVVVILVLLEQDRPGADVAASVVMAVALASSAVGLLTPITVGADLLARRERRVRRWLTFLPPVALWLAWYVAYGRGHTGAGGSAGSIFSFAGRELFAAFKGLAAGSAPGGVAVLVAVVALIVVAIVRWRSFDRLAVVIVATLAGFLFLTAAGRANAGAKFGVPAIPPDTDRYVWVDGLLVICLVVQLFRRRRIPLVALVCVAALTVANGVVLGRHLVDYRDVPVANARDVRTALVAIDALGPRADPSRNLPLGFIPVPTRDYQDLVRVYGSPVAHTRLSQLGTEHARVEADGWMVHDLGLHLANDAPGAPACDAPVGRAPSGGLAVRGPAVLEVRAGSAPVTVLVRRLAERFDGPALGTVAPGVTSTLRIPADRSTLSWRVELRGSGADVARCR